MLGFQQGNLFPGIISRCYKNNHTSLQVSKYPMIVTNNLHMGLAVCLSVSCVLIYLVSVIAERVD